MIRRLKLSSGPLIIHTCSPQLRRIGGFTLLELLVVIVIIGVMVAVATLSFGVLGRDRQSEDEMRRVWVLLQQAREEAEMQAEDIALFISADSYEFLRYESRRDRWELMEGDELFSSHELPQGLRFRLRLESRDVILKPGLPDRGDEDENKKWPPQVMVLSSGDVAPFELEVERDGAPSLWRVTALADNDLRVEKRDDRNGWGVIVQTKPPKEGEQVRVSNAR